MKSKKREGPPHHLLILTEGFVRERLFSSETSHSLRWLSHMVQEDG
jgi:hypothetical protein